MISFASICQIVKMIFINPTTIFRRLMKYRWDPEASALVPDRLSDLQKQARVIISKELLKLIKSMKRHLWKYIVMLYEAWFYFSAGHEWI
jgi:histidinol phosphatase-like enzyme